MIVSGFLPDRAPVRVPGTVPATVPVRATAPLAVIGTGRRRGVDGSGCSDRATGIAAKGILPTGLPLRLLRRVLPVPPVRRVGGVAAAFSAFWSMPS